MGKRKGDKIKRKGKRGRGIKGDLKVSHIKVVIIRYYHLIFTKVVQILRNIIRFHFCTVFSSEAPL